MTNYHWQFTSNGDYYRWSWIRRPRSKGRRIRRKWAKRAENWAWVRIVTVRHALVG